MSPVENVWHHSDLHNHVEDGPANPDWDGEPGLPATPALSIVNCEHEHNEGNPVASEWSKERDGDDSLVDSAEPLGIPESEGHPDDSSRPPGELSNNKGPVESAHNPSHVVQ